MLKRILLALVVLMTACAFSVTAGCEDTPGRGYGTDMGAYDLHVGEG